MASLPKDKKLSGIGLHKLQQQIEKKSIKKGILFNLMIVGEPECGKNSLINSLFGHKILGDDVFPNEDNIVISNLCEAEKPVVNVSGDVMTRDGSCYDSSLVIPVNAATTRTVVNENIVMYTCDLQEDEIKLRVNITKQVNFGAGIDNRGCWQAGVDYLVNQLESYLATEMLASRKNMKDNRVHAVIYCIPSYSHGLRPLDIKTMTELGKFANVVPVITKSDLLTVSEREKMKRAILEDITKHEIPIYSLKIDSRDDDDVQNMCNHIHKSFPLSIIAGDTIYNPNEEEIIMSNFRTQPWGQVSIDDELVSDFVLLRQLLIYSHMFVLKDETIAIYEKYRVQKISDSKTNLSSTDDESAIIYV